MAGADLRGRSGAVHRTVVALCWATAGCGEGLQLAQRALRVDVSVYVAGIKLLLGLRGRLPCGGWALIAKGWHTLATVWAAPPMRPSTASSTVAASSPPIITPSRDFQARAAPRWPVVARCSAREGDDGIAMQARRESSTTGLAICHSAAKAFERAAIE